MCRLVKPEGLPDPTGNMPAGIKADEKALWARVDALSRCVVCIATSFLDCLEQIPKAWWRNSFAITAKKTLLKTQGGHVTPCIA